MHALNRLYKWMVAGLLKPIRPDQPLGTPLFNSIARLSVSVGVDVIALRTTASGVVEVFSMKRDCREKSAPGLWHIPGTILRPGEGYPAAFCRLETHELGVAIKHATSIDESFTRDERGWYLMKTFLVELTDNPPSGSWFDVSRLPSDYYPFHRNHSIPAAVGGYLSTQPSPVLGTEAHV
jgi:ADP-ribose pyrophosphatase YjhB (NUDIX family)